MSHLEISTLCSPQIIRSLIKCIFQICVWKWFIKDLPIFTTKFKISPFNIKMSKSKLSTRQSDKDFKEQGNKYFNACKYDSAIDCYSKVNSLGYTYEKYI